MIKNYFKTALRNFWRNKIFSSINVLGLSIGISAALVIYLLVQFEFSFEKFRKDNDRIYRVTTERTFPGESVIKNAGVPMPLADAIRTDITGIETATHFIVTNAINVSVPVAANQSPVEFKKQKDIIYADEYYFSLFESGWLAGSKQNALKDPYQVVLTEERAKTYFGNLTANEIVGKKITYDDSITVLVSGIIKDQTEKATDFRFKEFISLATAMSTGLKKRFGGDDWGNIYSASQLFVKLKKGTKPEEFGPQLVAIREKYRDKKAQEKDDAKHNLQSLNSIHFDTDYASLGNARKAHKPTLYGLLAVALFLLLLGCINFINLTTAQSAQRAKEVGIRKTLGSGKRELVLQFLRETFILTLLATILSIVILPWLLNIFSDFLPSEISFRSINQPHVWIFLLLLVLVMTIFSGFYPALILTKFKPVAVLKNQVYAGAAKSGTAWLRRFLTVTQFVIAQFLVIATLVVSRQIHFSVNKDLGYKKDAIVYFPTVWNFFSNKPDDRRFVLLEKIKAMPEVEKVSLASNSPAHAGWTSMTMKVNNGKNEVELMTENINADPDYFDIYKLKLAAGKLPGQSDTLKEYLVNESFTRAFGFSDPEDAIGKFVDIDSRKIPIVGVLKDFHTTSTHDPIKPVAYSSIRKSSYSIHIALKPQTGSPGLWKAALDKIEREYKKLYIENPDFKYQFFDETIAAFYKKEQDISRLLKWSSGLCIFISCLGLLGLVIYTTNTRTKEIGIRKVLGASVVQLVSLLSKDLVSLVMLAFVIAAPLAWLAMNNWLQDFAYRTNISWWVFAICGISMLIIAVVVLGIRTIKAAIANPVKSLRTE